MQLVDSRFRSLLVGLFGAFVLFGASLTLIGATLPGIIADFAWSYTAAGFVFAASAVGYLVSTLLTGFAVDRLRPKRVICAGLAIQAVGLALFGMSPAAWVNVLVNFLIGFGQGGVEVVVNVSAVHMERPGQSRVMNHLHSAFAAGGIVGPLVAGLLIYKGVDWRVTFRLVAVVSAGTAVAMSALPFSRLGVRGDSAEGSAPVGVLLKDPLLILAFGILLLYVGTEVGVSKWLAQYYVDTFGQSTAIGALAVSIFWLGLLVGRAGLSYAYHGSRQAGLLLVLGITCTLWLAFAVLMPGPILAGVGFFLSGLGYSAIYPVVMAIVGENITRSRSAALGIVSTGGGIGALVVPFAVAAAADHIGLQRAFLIFVGVNVLMIGLMCMVIRRTRR